MINNSTNMTFRGFNMKEFSGSLKDGSKAVVRFAQDNDGRINSMMRFQIKNGRVVDGAGFGDNGGLGLKGVTQFLSKLQENAQEGVNFLKEFMEVMSK